MLLTQTTWLRMPALEVGSSLETPNRPYALGGALLKRHKILPHPREDQMADFRSSSPATKPRELVIDTEISSMPSSDTSSPRTLKHASRSIGAPVLPPTPPTHSRQSSGSPPIGSAASRYEASIKSPKDEPSGLSGPRTPPNQRSPPTPDVTPPRAMPLAFRPVLSDRYPSSRSLSFKTARENPYSSDEDDLSTVRPVLPSARPSENDVPQVPERSSKRKEVGLGLGLESDNEGTTTPTADANSRKEFVLFDGQWGFNAGELSEVEREWDDNLMRNVTVRKRPRRALPIFTDGPTDEVVEDDIVSPTNATKVVRGLPLQERITSHRVDRDAVDLTSAEKFAERIPWPSAVADLDVRRFSVMSGRSANSNVVEAMVVDAPPIRRRTLRHTKKQLGLRDFSSDQSTTSAPNSVNSSDQQHRLVHKRSWIPNQRPGFSYSNTTTSTTSSSGKSRREVISHGAIPVVVIPDRRSSTKSSRAPSLRSTSSHRTKRSMSLNSAPLSQSSKYNEPGYFDILPPRKRTMSESAGSAHSVRTLDYAPIIPVRRSSLSAPTSRDTSRAGSLTAESLKAHNLIQQKKQELLKPTPLKTQASAEPQSARMNFDHNGDPFFGNRTSTQATPFSQTSYETAGTTAEVSEALAVTLFPHQNKSLLVVQQQKAPEPSPPIPRTIHTSQAVTAIKSNVIIGPVTPPQPTHPMDEVDSPLRNPRAPPEPPAIKFIPPTPAGLTPTQEEDRQLGYPDERPATSDSKAKRGMSLIRRALTSRRNSESAVQPGVGFLQRTFSLSGRRKELSDESTQTREVNNQVTSLYPSIADRPADGNKLHPFWRPAHFWDDLEDHESDADDELGGRYPIIDNRPAPPKRSLSGKLKRTFAILPVKDDYEYPTYTADWRAVRRTASGNDRVVKRRSNSSLRRETSDRRNYGETGPDDFGYGFKDGNGGKRVHDIPGLGIRIEYVGWSGMKRRLSERRREQRSAKLRASISAPRGVQSGVDDVLRRKNQV